MPSIAPFLWFDTQAEQAARFYVSVFGRSRIVAIARYGDAGPGPAGSVMTVGFEFEGQPFTALNGGPVFSFTPAISLVVDCDTQAEIDTLWERLADGGGPQRCGWLQDRRGVSWQVVPRRMAAWMTDPDTTRTQRAMRAMLGMTKLDLAALQQAYEGN